MLYLDIASVLGHGPYQVPARAYLLWVGQVAWCVTICAKSCWSYARSRSSFIDCLPGGVKVFT